MFLRSYNVRLILRHMDAHIYYTHTQTHAYYAFISVYDVYWRQARGTKTIIMRARMLVIGKRAENIIVQYICASTNDRHVIIFCCRGACDQRYMRCYNFLWSANYSCVHRRLARRASSETCNYNFLLLARAKIFYKHMHLLKFAPLLCVSYT